MTTPEDIRESGAITPRIYEELRRLARRQLAREGRGVTLESKELVHEAWLRLGDGEGAGDDRRAYFFGAAGRAMRRVLVDHARRRNARKRGDGVSDVTLDTGHMEEDRSSMDLLELDGALTRLARKHPRAARVVECRFFAGLDNAETVLALGVSARTVKSDWALARAWLYRELNDQPESAPDDRVA